MSNKTATVYVTKYALTEGIQKKEVAIRDSGYATPIGDRFANSLTPKEYFHSIDEAIADCETRRQKKMLSLKKQYNKLEKMKFQ
jgi:hypothetical protein